MVTHARNAQSPENKKHLPLLVEALQHVAHEAVRNRGTLGGSLANADASAEMPLIMVALAAKLVLTSLEGERSVTAEDFFQGHYTTAIQPGELLTSIEIPFPDLSWAFEEVARRPGDFALGMVAVGVRTREGHCDAARIVLGCVGDKPLRAPEAEAFLLNKRLDSDVINAAAAVAIQTIKARTDIHASAEYRRSLTGVLVRRALTRATQGGSK